MRSGELREIDGLGTNWKWTKNYRQKVFLEDGEGIVVPKAQEYWAYLDNWLEPDEERKTQRIEELFGD